jgi:hypothetical protein
MSMYLHALGLKTPLATATTRSRTKQRGGGFTLLSLKRRHNAYPTCIVIHQSSYHLSPSLTQEAKKIDESSSCQLGPRCCSLGVCAWPRLLLFLLPNRQAPADPSPYHGNTEILSGRLAEKYTFLLLSDSLNLLIILYSFILLLI